MSWRKKLAELNATPDEPLTPEEEAVLAAFDAGVAAQKQRGAVASAARSNAFQYGNQKAAFDAGVAAEKQRETEANAARTNAFLYGNQKAAGLEWLDERYLINGAGKMQHVGTKAVHTLEHVYGELMRAFKVSRDTAKNWVTEWRKPFRINKL